MAPKPNKRNDKRRKAKKATKPLTKKQVVSYIRELKKLDMSQLCQCVKDKSLQDHHIMTSEIRSKLIGELCSEVIVEKFFDKYCYLYEKSHKGQFKDRYAMFQIDWNRFVTQFFDKSSESYKIVENIIGSSYLVSDISAAIHTIAKHLYGSMSLELQKLKTSALKPTSDTCQKDDIMSQLAFCGACVRKMYKKAKKHNHVEYLKLVHVVLMPKKQRLDFIKYNIITSPITKLWFIPKLALLPYIKHLNESIKESCSETSFALYGKQLVEVTATKITSLKRLPELFDRVVGGAQIAKGTLSFSQGTVTKFENELRRKMLYARLNGFIRYHYEREAALQGNLTSGAFTLRDDLYAAVKTAKKRSFQGS